MTFVATSELGRTESTLRLLELQVNRRLDGLLQGDHLGLVPATGTEPGEGREYVVGDDVRRIDWNLTARTNVTHVRDTIADRELETWIVVDRSASLDFGTAQCEKRDLALVAVGAVGFLTLRSANRVGGVVLAGEHSFHQPARSGRNALLALLHRIDGLPARRARRDERRALRRRAGTRRDRRPQARARGDRVGLPRVVRVGATGARARGSPRRARDRGHRSARARAPGCRRARAHRHRDRPSHRGADREREAAGALRRSRGRATAGDRARAARRGRRAHGAAHRPRLDLRHRAVRRQPPPAARRATRSRHELPRGLAARPAPARRRAARRVRDRAAAAPQVRRALHQRRSPGVGRAEAAGLAAPPRGGVPAARVGVVGGRVRAPDLADEGPA